MLSHLSIGAKLRVGVGLLAASTLILFLAALYGLYAYRGLVKTLSARSTEMPLANELSHRVADLGVVLSTAREEQKDVNETTDDADDLALIITGEMDSAAEPPVEVIWKAKLAREQFRAEFVRLKDTLEAYRAKLDANQASDDSRIARAEPERQTLRKIDTLLAEIDREGMADKLLLDDLGEETGLARVGGRAAPRADDPAAKPPAPPVEHALGRGPLAVPRGDHPGVGDVRLGDRAARVGDQVFHTAVARPVQRLVEGARKVASGDFGHRIAIESRDEMGELADAMNRMMASFQQTRDDLDQQVRDRTNQVIRSEQLASVGFLAAGVAHEINNPLAAIAMCSESLESRLANSARGIRVTPPSGRS